MPSSLLKIADQEMADEHAGHCHSSVAINVFQHDSHIEPKAFRGRAAVVTLGCAKNQVDSEVMIGVLRNSGYEIVSDLSRADIAVVNTCGFLQSAVKESIDSILEVAEHKKTGRLRSLIVAGCLVERYRDDLKKSLPEVDSFVLLDDILKVAEVAESAASSDASSAANVLERSARPYFLYDETMPRQLASGRHMAYVKIAEGCNRPCTFCIIPKIRGAMRSRSINSVVQEVIALGAQGIKEINLVAQDLTSYGSDHKENLSQLLHALNGNCNVPWIRLLYAYPLGINDQLLDSIVELPKICNYLDLPLQHASEAILKQMQRPLGKYSPRKLIEYIRHRQPLIEIRTTFIVGFPGETESDVQELENFIREGHFSSVGVFTYSPEEGTPAHSMSGQISQAQKTKRRDRLMLAQQEVVAQRQQVMLGREYEVLVEGIHSDTDLLLAARTRFQAPEVDPIVILNDISEGVVSPAAGTLGRVRITDIAGYDLVGTFLG